MQSYQDIRFERHTETEHVYFRVNEDGQYDPYLDFIPWPIRVSALMFTDGTSMDTASSGGGAQTPWISNINGDGFDLFDVGNISADNLDVTTINGAPLSALQTPWLSDIDGNGFNLLVSDAQIFFTNGGASSGSITGFVFGAPGIGIITPGFSQISGSSGIYLTTPAVVNVTSANTQLISGGSNIQTGYFTDGILMMAGAPGFVFGAPGTSTNITFSIAGNIATINSTAPDVFAVGADSATVIEFNGPAAQIELYAPDVINLRSGNLFITDYNGTVTKLSVIGDNAVGIGLSDPQYQLDVYGVMNVTSRGDFFSPSYTIQPDPFGNPSVISSYRYFVNAGEFQLYSTGSFRLFSDNHLLLQCGLGYAVELVTAGVTMFDFRSDNTTYANITFPFGGMQLRSSPATVFGAVSILQLNSGIEYVRADGGVGHTSGADPGSVKIKLLTYASNAAAVADGLTPGYLYTDGAGGVFTVF